MNENHDQNDSRQDFSDERLVEILSAGSDRASPPDRAFLSRLRERSTQLFLDSDPTVSPAPPGNNPMLFIRSFIGLALAGASTWEVPVAGVEGRLRTVFFVDREAAAEVPEDLIATEY